MRIHGRVLDRSRVRVQNLNLELFDVEEPISQGRSLVLMVGSFGDKHIGSFSFSGIPVPLHKNINVINY